MKVVKQQVENLSCTPNALQLIEVAGRKCYQSKVSDWVNSSERFTKMIIERGHESVLEHASATFNVITDRGISHEIVRHRLAAYSQESTRYVKYGDISVVLPQSLNDGTWFNNYGTKQSIEITEEDLCSLTDIQKRWVQSCLMAETVYKEMIDRGVKPQDARSVLPTCLKTELVWTANFREWRHIIRMRQNKGAHPQVQELVRFIKGWFKINYPVIVSDL